jgi:RNA polymerase sigma-70 factor (ECF subfamily)
LVREEPTVTHEVESHCLGQADADLVAGLYPDLRSFASVVAPPREDPNDLVQEALLRTLRRGSLSRLDHPKAYLRMVIYHLAVSARRHWAAERNAAVQVVARNVALDDPWEVDELPRLKPKARAVLYLHVVEGMTFDEIGDLLGCTAAAARKTASRAKRRLRRLLAGEVDDATA